MDIWLIQRLDSRCGYDEAAGFVVRAKTGNRARELAAEGSGDEGRAMWLEMYRSTCESIGTAHDKTEGVILIDFRAG